LIVYLDASVVASVAMLEPGWERVTKSPSRLGILARDWRRLPIENRDIEEAIDLVAKVTLSLRLPDAIHIAVARRVGATLITNDRQQHRAARTLGVLALNPLEQIP